jgi:hypothetical protein
VKRDLLQRNAGAMQANLLGRRAKRDQALGERFGAHQQQARFLEHPPSRTEMRRLLQTHLRIRAVK